MSSVPEHDMSPDASPGQLSKGAGVRRVNNVPLYLLGSTMAIFLDSDRSVFFRGMLAVFFQFLTTPAATHLLARAAYIRDYPVSDRTAVDELAAFLPSLPDEPIGGKE